MSELAYPLMFTAVSLGFIHTLLGPDHYLPFVALSKSNNWSFKKTLWISGVCGIGHCFSSVLIGFLGIALGVVVGKLETIEGTRGEGGLGQLSANFDWAGLLCLVRQEPD